MIANCKITGDCGRLRDLFTENTPNRRIIIRDWGYFYDNDKLKLITWAGQGLHPFY
jgi:hypothetical protein